MEIISISNLFQKSFELYQRKFSGILKITLVNVLFSVGTFILGIFIPTMSPSYWQNNPRPEDLISHLPSISIMLLVGLVWILVSAWVQLALLYYIQSSQNDGSVSEYFKTAWINLSAFAFTYFIVGCMILLGTILLIIPGIIFGIWYSLWMFVFTKEGLRGKKAMTRSKELVKGNWWSVFWRFFVFGIVSFFVGILENKIPLLGLLLTVLFWAPLGMIYSYSLYENLVTSSLPKSE